MDIYGLYLPHLASLCDVSPDFRELFLALLQYVLAVVLSENKADKSNLGICRQCSCLMM